MSKFIFSLALLVLLSLVVGNSSCLGQDATQIKALAAWKERRNSVSNVSCTIEVVKRLHKLRNSDSACDLLEEDFVCTNTLTFQFDMVSGHFRFEEQGSEFNARVKKATNISNIESFNGIEFKSMAMPPPGKTTDTGSGGRKASDYAIVKNNFSGENVDPHALPIFASFGLVTISPNTKLHPGQFHKYTPESESDLLAPTQVRPADILFETFPMSGGAFSRNSFTLNNTDLSIAGFSTWHNKKPLQEYTLERSSTDSTKLQSWIMKGYLIKDGRLWCTEKATVKSLIFNSPEFTFGSDPIPSAGMKASVITVPSNDSDKDNYQRENFVVEEGGKLVPVDSTKSPRSKWLVAPIILFLLAIFSVYYFRRKSKPSTTPTL